MSLKNFKIPALVISLLLLTATSASAAPNFEVYVYGSGNFIASIFKGISMVFYSSSALVHLVEIMILLGLFAGLLGPLVGSMIPHSGPSTGAEGFLIMGRQVLLGVVAVYGLMLPKANVMITDQVDLSQSQQVDNVPYVNAAFAWAASQIGYGIGQLLEQNIMPVDAPTFTNGGGVGLGAKYVNDLLDIQPPTAPSDYAGGSGLVSINMVLQNYFERCVIPNFGYINGDTDPGQAAQAFYIIQNAPDILGGLQALPNTAFTDPNTTLNINFTTDQPETCATAIPDIQTQWATVYTPWISNFNIQSIGNNLADPGGMVTMGVLLNRYFPNSSGSPQQQIMQVAVLNGIRSAALSFDAMYGNGNQKDNLMMAKTGSGWVEAARLFNKVVLMMRQLFEALIFSMSIFLPVFFAIAGFGAIKTYAKIALWLQMWVPFFVILNAFADSQFVTVIGNALYNSNINTSNFGLSFSNVETVRTQANLVLGYIGAFSWSVPTLAWAVVKGGDYAMSHAIGAATSGSGGQSVAQSVGSEVGGAGNLSLGERRIGNTRSFSSTGFTSWGQMMGGTAAAEATRRLVDHNGGVAPYMNAASNAKFFDSQSQISKVQNLDASGVKPEATGKFQSTSLQGQMQHLQGEVTAAGGMGNYLQGKRGMGEKEMGAFNSEVAQYQALKPGSTYDQAALAVGVAAGMGEGINAAGKETLIQGAGARAVMEGNLAQDTHKVASGQVVKQEGKIAGHDMDTVPGMTDFFKSQEFSKEQPLGTLDQKGAGNFNDLLSQSGWNYRAEAGSTVSAAFSSDGKNVMSFSGKSKDGSTLFKGEGGQITEQTVKDGLTNVKQTGQDGKVISETSTGVLSDQGAQNLRQEMSHSPRFASGASHVEGGMNANIVRGGDGKLSDVSLSHGNRIAYNSKVDGTNTTDTGNRSTRGDKDTSYNHFKQSFAGDQSWSGHLSENVNTDVQKGVMFVDVPKPGGKPGETIQAAAQGEIYSYKDDKGVSHTIGGSFFNGTNKDTVEWARDTDGNQHFAVTKGKLDPQGRWVAGDQTSTSTSSHQQGGGFWVSQVWDGAPGKGGNLIYDSSKRGQRVSDEHTKLVDNTVEMRQNAGAAVFGADQNLRNTTGAQDASMVILESVDRGVDAFGKMIMLKNGIQGLRPPATEESEGFKPAVKRVKSNPPWRGSRGLPFK